MGDFGEPTGDSFGGVFLLSMAGNGVFGKSEEKRSRAGNHHSGDDPAYLLN